MRILVTGASGFLGAHVVRVLYGSGWRVRAISRRSGRGLESLAADVERVDADLLDARSLERAVLGVDVVVHTAGYVSLRRRDRTRLFKINVEGTRNILAASRMVGARLLHTSSVAAIGSTPEPDVLDEASPYHQVVAGYDYADSKVQAEQLVLEAAASGLDAVILNPGTMFGPGDWNLTSTRMVLHYLLGQYRAYSTGGMSFCDVRDVAAAYARAVVSGRRGERYVLAGVNLSYRELLEKLSAITGLPRPIAVPSALLRASANVSDFAAALFPHPFEEFTTASASYGLKFNFCSSAKAERELGYRIRPFEQTLADTIRDLSARNLVREVALVGETRP
jgi:dihydroflavonol-4-reductase